MSYTRTSFIYDPLRQGYDTNSWRTLSGAPAVVGGRLSVDNSVGIAGSAIHYVDFVKGDISFNVNVPAAPSEDGVVRIFGASSPSGSAHVYFSIGTSLICETSNGINTSVSSAILWDSAWTGANIIYQIVWESGFAKFKINGTQVYEVADISVPYGPLSLYLYDGSENSMTVGDMSVKCTQSYVVSPKTSDTTPVPVVGKLNMFQNVTLTESATILIPSIKIPFVSGGMSESIVVSENVSSFITEQFLSTFDAVSITEDIVNTIIEP